MKSRAGLCARRSAVGTEADPTHDRKGPLFALSSFAAAGNSWPQEDRSSFVWASPRQTIHGAKRQVMF